MYMVERTPYTGNVGYLFGELEQTSTKLEQMAGTSQAISRAELNALIGDLQRANKTMEVEGPALLVGKKLATEPMNTTIERALRASQLFQLGQSDASRIACLKNVDQAIISLSSALKKAMETFEKNLKRFKIGRKVEKTAKTKESSPDK